MLKLLRLGFAAVRLREGKVSLECRSDVGSSDIVVRPRGKAGGSECERGKKRLCRRGERQGAKKKLWNQT